MTGSSLLIELRGIHYQIRIRLSHHLVPLGGVPLNHGSLRGKSVASSCVRGSISLGSQVILECFLANPRAHAHDLLLPTFPVLLRGRRWLWVSAASRVRSNYGVTRWKPEMARGNVCERLMSISFRSRCGFRLWSRNVRYSELF